MMRYNIFATANRQGEKLFLTLPDWSTFDPEETIKELEALFACGRKEADLSAQKEVHTFASLVERFEELNEKIARTFAPLAHLNGAMQTDAIRDAHNKAIALYSDFGSDMNMHEGVYRAYLRYRESCEYSTRSAEERKIVNDTIEDFELAGVGLPPKAKRKLKALNKKIARLATRFENNIKMAMRCWTTLVSDEGRLAGVSQATKDAMRKAAAKKNQKGFLVSLQQSIMFEILEHAADRDLRKEVFIARARQASDLGPNPKRLDNRPLLEKILAMQYESTQLLGYENFAELSLRKKMAKSPEVALEFLDELAAKSHKRAHDEFIALEAFAARELGLAKLEPWDIAYASEKLSVAMHNISQKELRPYFTATRVFDGMFKLVERLYGLYIREALGADKPSVWDPSVRFFKVYDKERQLRAAFYADLYERSDKKVRKSPGAWADGCMNRRKLSYGTQIPVASLNCNNTPPADGEEGQLTHDNVITLFHEFGHVLHHMLGLPYYASSNWMHLEYDAIELPSQFMENYCWSREMLKSLSCHVDTGEQIPDELCDRLLASKHFQAGMVTARQLEFALIDMELYAAGTPCDIDAIVRDVRRRVRVVPVYDEDRFLNSFTHIFSGGYSAGYYGYKWAEVLAADAFEAFAETGDIYNPHVAAKFLGEVLEASGKRKMAESYVAFRGRMPSVDALLRQSGLLKK